jgi:hypothetical protein
MSKSISSKLADSKKFLEKNAKSNLNLKQALSALADAEKTATEISALKAKLSDLAEAREASIGALDQAMARVKLEKRLKAKEAKVQARLANLSTSGDAAK